MCTGTARAKPGGEATEVPRKFPGSSPEVPLMRIRWFHGSDVNGPPRTPSCPPAGWGAGRFTPSFLLNDPFCTFSPFPSVPLTKDPLS